MTTVIRETTENVLAYDESTNENLWVAVIHYEHI
jgi:hypothetical protein